MDPISLIERALAVGTALGVRGSASPDQRDAYAQLKSMVRYRLADRPKAEEILADHEEDPETYQAPLMKVLSQIGAGEDRALVEAARALLTRVDSAGARAGKFDIDYYGEDRAGCATPDVSGGGIRKPSGEPAGGGIDLGGGGGSPAGGTTDD